MKRRDSRSAGYAADLCQYPSRFISWGYQGEFFQVRHGENLKSFLLWMVGIEHQKTHGLSTTPFVKELVGY